MRQRRWKLIAIQMTSRRLSHTPLHPISTGWSTIRLERSLIPKHSQLQSDQGLHDLKQIGITTPRSNPGHSNVVLIYIYIAVLIPSQVLCVVRGLAFAEHVHDIIWLIKLKYTIEPNNFLNDCTCAFTDPTNQKDLKRTNWRPQELILAGAHQSNQPELVQTLEAQAALWWGQIWETEREHAVLTLIAFLADSMAETLRQWSVSCLSCKLDSPLASTGWDVGCFFQGTIS